MSIATAWNDAQAVKATKVRQEIADALVGYLKDHPDATRLQCAEEVFRQTGHRYSAHSISRSLKLIGVNFKHRERVDTKLVIELAGPAPWPRGTIGSVCKRYEERAGKAIDDSTVGLILRRVGYTSSRPRPVTTLKRADIDALIAKAEVKAKTRHPFKLPTPLRMAAIIGRVRMGVWDSP
jgi:hypothetical protein